MPVYHEESRLPSFIHLLFASNFFIFGVLYWYDPNEVLFWVMGLVFLIGVLLVIFRLSLVISQEQISIQLFPFHLKPRIWKWEEIKHAELIKISALGDFGGWGLRYSGKHGWGYITSGGKGLKLETVDEKKLVISIKHQEELRAFLIENDLVDKVIVD